MRMRFSACVMACVVAALAGCSNKRARSEAAVTPPATDQAAVAPVAPEKPAETEAREDRSSSKKEKLRLTLRSTPTGAKAAVDGRPVGETPMIHEMESDGRVHEFTFVLTGYSMERYKFPPVRDGVVHATLRPIPQPDAGPK